MRKYYDFSKAKRSPYPKLLKEQVTINLAKSTIAYFKEMANETGIGYQLLIDLYLRECVSRRRKLAFLKSAA